MSVAMYNCTCTKQNQLWENPSSFDRLREWLSAKTEWVYSVAIQLTKYRTMGLAVNEIGVSASGRQNFGGQNAVDKGVLVHLSVLVPFGLFTEKNRYQRFVLMRIASVSRIQSTTTSNQGSRVSTPRVPFIVPREVKQQ